VIKNPNLQGFFLIKSTYTVTPSGDRYIKPSRFSSDK